MDGTNNCPVKTKEDQNELLKRGRRNQNEDMEEMGNGQRVGGLVVVLSR